MVRLSLPRWALSGYTRRHTLLSYGCKKWWSLASLDVCLPRLLLYRTTATFGFDRSQHCALVNHYLMQRESHDSHKNEIADSLVHDLRMILRPDINVTTIKARLALLQLIGCRVDDIIAQPDILLLSEEEIEQMRDRLKTYSLFPVSVELLKKLHTNPKSLKFSQNSSKPSQIGRLMEILECDAMQLATILSRCPTLLYVRTSGKECTLQQKVTLLQSHGVLLETIHNCPQVLCKSASHIEERVIKLKEIGVEQPLPLMWICQNKKRFQKIVDKFAREKDILKDRTKIQTIADLLQVKERHVQNENVFVEHSITNIKQKIDCLLENGVISQVLAEHSFILGYSLQRLQNAINQLRHLGIEHMDPLQIYWMMIKDRLSQKVGARSTLKQQKIFNNLLQLNSFHNKKDMVEKLGHLLHQPLEEMEQKLELFRQHGFPRRIVSECPLVLGHNLQFLETYLSGLPSCGESQTYDTWLQDRVKLLNALQYFIEKTVNFSHIALQENELAIETGVKTAVKKWLFTL